MILLDITPVPKPRQTRADKWKKRPSVLRYRAFADEIRLKLDSGTDLNDCNIKFALPMPKSWSKKKKKEMDGMPHQQTPDIDNLIKALLDAVYSNDSGIHSLGKIKKIWSTKGHIVICEGQD